MPYNNLPPFKFVLILMIVGLVILSLGACKSIPPDNSMIWAENNRYAIEMENNCNLTTKSVGLSGCAFKDYVLQGATINIPTHWATKLDFISSNCLVKQYSIGAQESLRVNLVDLYTNDRKSSCSFQINRKVLAIGKHVPDKQMLGRFFVKIIPNNKYYKKMSIHIADNTFSGVAWYQSKYKEVPPSVKVYPRGSEGMIIVKCGEDYVLRDSFSTTPIDVVLPQGRNCDYEFSVINNDTPYIEFGTVVYEENKATQDINLPRTYVKRKRRYFTFDTTKTDAGKNAVIAVKINGAVCFGHVCKLKQTTGKYTVRAITGSLRYFYGVFDSSTGNWEGVY